MSKFLSLIIIILSLQSWAKADSIKELDIEGILLTMYDSRLRLSNQVVDEVKKHFGDIVFKTIIQRNIKLGEAPGFGKDIITYDVSSKGTKNYLSLADEIIKKNVNV